MTHVCSVLMALVEWPWRCLLLAHASSSTNCLHEAHSKSGTAVQLWTFPLRHKSSVRMDFHAWRQSCTRAIRPCVRPSTPASGSGWPPPRVQAAHQRITQRRTQLTLFRRPQLRSISDTMLQPLSAALARQVRQQRRSVSFQAQGLLIAARAPVARRQRRLQQAMRTSAAAHCRRQAMSRRPPSVQVRTVLTTLRLSMPRKYAQ